MRVPAIASLIGVPFTFLFYLWPDARTAILLSIPAAMLGPFYLGPTFAMTQSLVKPHMRAVASSILLFIINLVGLGLGPLFVGMLSDCAEADLRHRRDPLRAALDRRVGRESRRRCSTCSRRGRCARICWRRTDLS